jgi:hypothetical protein
LASIDRLRFITACRHGLIHLTWGRITLRLGRNEFRRMVRFLDATATNPATAQVRDGEVRLTLRIDEESEFRVGAAVLLLAPNEFSAFVSLCRQARDELEKILASGVWDRDQVDDEPPDHLAQFKPDSFSKN